MNVSADEIIETIKRAGFPDYVVSQLQLRASALQATLDEMERERGVPAATETSVKRTKGGTI